MCVPVSAPLKSTSRRRSLGLSIGAPQQQASRHVGFKSISHILRNTIAREIQTDGSAVLRSKNMFRCLNQKIPLREVVNRWVSE